MTSSVQPPSPAEADVPLCSNLDHGKRALAIATVTFPQGPYRPMKACSGCVRTALLQALDECIAVLVEPVAEAYGVCPVCESKVRLRPSGLIGAHRWRWVKCGGQGREPVPGARPVKDVELPTASGAISTTQTEEA